MKPLFLALTALLAAPAFAQPPNLLAKAQLRKGDKVQNPARMTDGIAPVEGEMWNSEWAAIVGADAVAEWDLGEPMQVQAALVQGDNNDTYIVTGSLDGETFFPIWRAGSVEGAGMRLRTTKELNANARYIRLTAEGGDKLYSVGELVLLSNAGDLNTYDIARKDKPRDPPPSLNTSWLVVGAVVVLLVLFLRKRPVVVEAAPTTPAAAPPPDEKKPESEEPKKS